MPSTADRQRIMQRFELIATAATSPWITDARADVQRGGCTIVSQPNST